MRNIGFFPLWMIEQHRAERGGGAWPAGAGHPVRGKAQAWSLLRLARIDLSVFVSGGTRVKGDMGLTLDLTSNCLLFHLLIAYWIKGAFRTAGKERGHLCLS